MESEQFKAAKELLNKKLRELGINVDDSRVKEVYESPYNGSRCMGVPSSCANLMK